MAPTFAMARLKPARKAVSSDARPRASNRANASRGRQAIDARKVAVFRPKQRGRPVYRLLARPRAFRANLKANRPTTITGVACCQLLKC
jgi:hypothetical protein